MTFLWNGECLLSLHLVLECPLFQRLFCVANIYVESVAFVQCAKILMLFCALMLVSVACLNILTLVTMCVYRCVCVYGCVHMCMCTYAYVYLCVCVPMFLYTYVYMYLCACTNVYLYLCVYVPVYMYLCVCVPVYVQPICRFVYLCTCTDVYGCQRERTSENGNGSFFTISCLLKFVCL